jgi:hypothetical protein
MNLAEDLIKPISGQDQWEIVKMFPLGVQELGENFMDLRPQSRSER